MHARKLRLFEGVNLFADVVIKCLDYEFADKYRTQALNLQVLDQISSFICYFCDSVWLSIYTLDKNDLLIQTSRFDDINDIECSIVLMAYIHQFHNFLNSVKYSSLSASWFKDIWFVVLDSPIIWTWLVFLKFVNPYILEIILQLFFLSFSL